MAAVRPGASTANPQSWGSAVGVVYSTTSAWQKAADPEESRSLLYSSIEYAGALAKTMSLRRQGPDDSKGDSPQTGLESGSYLVGSPRSGPLVQGVFRV